MEELILKLKKELIEVLNLEDLTPDDLVTEDPLFGEGLGLDSIDALEIMVLLEKNYGIKIEDPKQGRKVFYSIKTIADHIMEHQNQQTRPRQ
ncbi:MAG TPA: phosphopantetheine-binding protein [Thermodesulfobacteriota bacterium]|nr:phosphopantetheine-binding protein [Thermodesulfobacteriota bacterium]